MGLKNKFENKNNKKVAVCWSGGKDSALAYLKTIQSGYKVSFLFNLINNNSLVSFHFIPKKMISLQSKALGVPLIQKEIIFQKEDQELFEKELEILFRELKNKGVDGLVFGYILPNDYQHHLVKRLCAELGLDLILPLYKKKSDFILKSLIKSNFKSILVDINLKYIDEKWLGQFIDKDFYDYFLKNKKADMDICGDKGEFHSFLIDCPFFKKRIGISGISKINNGHYLFLKIKKYYLKEKS